MLLIMALLLVPNMPKVTQVIDHWRVDLNGNGKKEEVRLVVESDTLLHVIVDGTDFNLETNILGPIYDQTGQSHDALFADLKSNGRKEILVGGGDPNGGAPTFGDRFYLTILEYRRHKLKLMPVVSEGGDSTLGIPCRADLINSTPKHGLIDRGYYLIMYDYRTNCIYTESGTVPFNLASVFLDDLSLYKWNPTIGCIVQFGNKVFDRFDLKDLRHEAF